MGHRPLGPGEINGLLVPSLRVKLIKLLTDHLLLVTATKVQSNIYGLLGWLFLKLTLDVMTYSCWVEVP